MAQAIPMWFEEYLTPHLLQSMAVRREVFSGETAYQQVQVLETAAFGRCLVLDGKIQSAESDEFIYHEALVHPALVTHPNPETVFIAGGGEGATLREALRHSTVKRAVMVDLDGEVVEICRRFLPSFHAGAFEDPRAELHTTDARGHLESNRDTYDVMFMDLPDPQDGGPAALLYTQSFYRLLLSRLNPGGIIVVQSVSCMEGHTQAFSAISSTLATVFPHVFPYRAMVPSFAAEWGYNMASLGTDPVSMGDQEVDRRLSLRGCTDLRSYDGEAHRGLFALPKHIRVAMKREAQVVTEDNPLVVF